VSGGAGRAESFGMGEAGRKNDRRSCVSVNFTIFVHCRKNVRYVR